ncbi:hypothetical protein ABIA94_008566 [Bradyrhizobium sp. LA7.1]
MPHHLPVFETLLKKRGRIWSWSVCTTEGRVVMLGTENRRTSARYKANRALFLRSISDRRGAMEKKSVRIGDAWNS